MQDEMERWLRSLDRGVMDLTESVNAAHERIGNIEKRLDSIEKRLGEGLTPEMKKILEEIFGEYDETFKKLKDR